MENENKITPVGLKGREINERMIQLMGIKPINENNSKSVVELTKIGPDGIAYAIVRENHEYYIKTSTKKSNLITEDFGYIGGLQNKKSEAYPSYAKAIKHLNLKFNSLSESLDKGHNINVFENDNLLKENGIAGFSNYSGNGFSGQGNLDGDASLFEEDKKENNPWAICTARVGRENKDKYESCVIDIKKEKGIAESITENEYCGTEEEEVELTEVEKAVEDIKNKGEYFGGEKQKLGIDSDGDGVPDGADKDPKDGSIKENRLTIDRALKNMDSIIDSLTEGTLKKKVYTLK